MECCDTCKLRYEIQRWDYSHGGCEHTNPEGHVCMAFRSEGIAVWMVGNTGMCEAYTPLQKD